MNTREITVKQFSSGSSWEMKQKHFVNAGGIAIHFHSQVV